MEHKINLAQALVNAQAHMPAAPKNGYNPHFRNRFSTLEDLIESTRAILTKNGLAVTQYPDSDTNGTYLVTKLKHISGEEEVSRALILIKDPTDIQKLGSAISYMKRYAYAAICGIATSEGDDDGNTNGNGTSNGNGHSRPPIAEASEPASDVVSPKQAALLRSRINNNLDLEKAICAKYQIPTLDKLPWKRMNELLAVLEKQA